MGHSNRKKIIMSVLVFAVGALFVVGLMSLLDTNRANIIKYKIQDSIKNVSNFLNGEKEENNFKYVKNGDGTCKITGYTGKTNYVNDIDKLGDELNIPVLNIPEKINELTVTEIGNMAFSTCDLRVTDTSFEMWPPSLAGSLTMPNSITTIGYRAFYNCRDFNSVTIPEHITEIKNEAFAGNWNLITNVEFLGDAPTEFGNRVFDGSASSDYNFHIIYDPTKSGWSTPEWNGCPAYPKSLE